MDENKLQEMENKVNTLWNIHTYGITIILIGVGIYFISKKYGK